MPCSQVTYLGPICKQRQPWPACVAPQLDRRQGTFFIVELADILDGTTVHKSIAQDKRVVACQRKRTSTELTTVMGALLYLLGCCLVLSTAH
jgi:hypothetical protein